MWILTLQNNNWTLEIIFYLFEMKSCKGKHINGKESVLISGETFEKKEIRTFK